MTSPPNGTVSGIGTGRGFGPDESLPLAEWSPLRVSSPDENRAPKPEPVAQRRAITEGRSDWSAHLYNLFEIAPKRCVRWARDRLVSDAIGIIPTARSWFS